MYESWLSWLIRWILSKTSYPLLPQPNEINAEVKTLQTINPKEHLYVDMLLDVHETGYQNAAIWNVLQKQEQIRSHTFFWHTHRSIRRTTATRLFSCKLTP